MRIEKLNDMLDPSPDVSRTNEKINYDSQKKPPIKSYDADPPTLLSVPSHPPHPIATHGPQASTTPPTTIPNKLTPTPIHPTCWRPAPPVGVAAAAPALVDELRAAEAALAIVEDEEATVVWESEEEDEWEEGVLLAEGEAPAVVRERRVSDRQTESQPELRKSLPLVVEL